MTIEYNELIKKVEELETRIQALETNNESHDGYVVFRKRVIFNSQVFDKDKNVVIN